MTERRRYRDAVHDSARWDGFVFREGDIVISTPPKCGTTWLQTICALLVLGDPSLPKHLSDLSPWLDMQIRSVEEVFADLAAQTHRRFIKTHTPLDGLPWDDRATYLTVGRDPRDAMVSKGDHAENLDFARALDLRSAAVGLDDLHELEHDDLPPLANRRDEVMHMVVDDRPIGLANRSSPQSLRAIVEHLAGFWAVRDRPNVHLFHYADLVHDLDGQMRRLAGILDVPARRRWDELVAAATFESMKAAAERLAPDARLGTWRNDAAFFRAGGFRRWEGILDADDLATYDQRIATLAPDDRFRAWLHDGGKT